MLFCFQVHSQSKTNTFIKNILLQNRDTFFLKIITNPELYRLQIIYTEINRDKQNKPSFTNHYFGVNPQQYYYPASVVKLPLAALSLEKLNELKEKGIDKFTLMQFDSAYPNQIAELTDSTSATGLPSMAQFIRKAFLISDNDAYNRMYQFVSQQRINEKLHKKGYKNVRITRQFMGFTEAENRHTNPIRFVDRNKQIVYEQPMAYNRDSFNFPSHVYIGKAYYNRNDSLVNEPMNFAKHNTILLQDLQQILQSILFPSSVSQKQRFDLTKDDYDFLKQYLSQYPSQTPYPKYDTAEYYDSYVKFFFNDSNHHHMPANIRVFNKVGWAYGFLTDVSYVADFKSNIEYMLTATIYTNSDKVLNDNKYEFESVGQPFLYQLGQTIYNYDLHRKRRIEPDLSSFKVKYEHRDPNDNRPSIKNADN